MKKIIFAMLICIICLLSTGCNVYTSPKLLNFSFFKNVKITTINAVKGINIEIDSTLDKETNKPVIHVPK